MAPPVGCRVSPVAATKRETDKPVLRLVRGGRQKKPPRLASEEVRKLIKKVESLEKQVAEATADAAKSLEKYKSNSVSKREYELVVSRSEEERRLAQEFADRNIKLRQLKLEHEESLEKAKAARESLREELTDRDAYVVRLEGLLKRNQDYLDRCMANLPKVGPVPIGHCNDCGQPFPITSFKLTTASAANGKNWGIVPYCKVCLRERNKRIDIKRKEQTAAARNPIDDATHVRQMAESIAKGVRGER